MIKRLLKKSYKYLTNPVQLSKRILSKISKKHFFLRKIYLKVDSKGIYKGELVDHILDVVIKIENDIISVDDGIKKIKNLISEFIKNGEFEKYIKLKPDFSGKVYLYEHKDKFEKKRIRLQLFHIPANESHPPHSHKDMASLQIVLKGNLRAKEYQLLEKYNNEIKVSVAFDGLLEVGDGMLTTNTLNNIHWFGSLDEDVISLNFNLKGFYQDGSKKKGRNYVDPTVSKPDSNMKMTIPYISEELAENKFAGKRIDEF